MITGHCTSGIEAMHAKCTQPGRCTCTCHTDDQAVPAETGPVTIEENTVPEIPCGICDRTFGSNQAAAVHRARGHKPKPLPVEEDGTGTALPEIEEQTVERTAPPATSALYSILGWYGGLYIDLTVETGTELIDPEKLRAVIGLAAALAE